MAGALRVAAPAPGQGKTRVAAGLARLHARPGSRMRGLKCGPDFIDPVGLSPASGHAVDPMHRWLRSEDDSAPRLAAAAAAEACLVIVDGVMGPFDGKPSAADLAQRFGLPVPAVPWVDAQGVSQPTWGLRASGFRPWWPSSPRRAAWWFGAQVSACKRCCTSPARAAARPRVMLRVAGGARRVQDLPGESP